MHMLLTTSVCSAFLGFLSRYAPDFFAEFVFFDSVPIIYLLTFYKKPLRYQMILIVLWVALFHAFAGIGILGIFDDYGSKILWMNMYLFFIIYASLIAIIIFCVTRRITQSFRKLTVLIFLSVFWIFIDTAFFIPFGNLEGNRLFSPLVPLAARPQWLFFCRYFPEKLCIIFVIITNYIICCILFASLKRKSRYFCIASLCLFWMSGWLLWDWREYSKDLDMLAKKCAAPVVSMNNINSEGFIDWCRKKENITWIFLPETFLCCYEKSLISEYCSWYDLINDHITIISGGAIIGSSKTMKNKTHNVILKICSTHAEVLYEKKQNMFLTESKSTFLTWCGLQKSFKYQYADKEFLTNKRHANNEIMIEGFGKIKPYICSEFIFHQNFFKTNSENGTTILWIVNDVWSKHAYVGNLMVLYARQQAIARRQRVFYIGYATACVFDEFGMKYQLAT